MGPAGGGHPQRDAQRAPAQPGETTFELTFRYTNRGKHAYALVHFDRGSKDASLFRIEPGVPSTITIATDVTCVCVQGVARYATRYGQDANMLEGRSVTYVRELGLDGPDIVKLMFPYEDTRCSGRVTCTRVSGGTPADGVFSATRVIDRHDAGSDMEDLARRNTVWYRELKPVTPILRNIQLPRMNGMNVPGWAFMLDQPVAPSGEAFFENLIRVSVRRYGLLESDYIESNARTRAVIVADAFQAIANHVIYITDYSISAKGERTEIDWFSSMSRMISGGDCEDSAKEIIMLCRELQEQTWLAGGLVAAAADALRNYVCTMALGSVQGPRLGDHEDGTYGALAHAFVFLVPRDTFEQLLAPGLRLSIPEPSVRDAMHPMTLDGTNLKCVEDVRSTERAPNPSGGRTGGLTYKDAIGTFGARREDGHVAVTHAGDRIKGYTETTDGFYLHVVSLLTFSVHGDGGARAFQLYLRDGATYGVTFADMCASRTGVSLVPTCMAAPWEVRGCRDAMRHLPPIGPHSYSERSRERFTERVYAFLKPVGATGPVSSNGRIALSGDDAAFTPDATVFASYEDAFKPDMIDGIKSLLTRATAVTAAPEYMSDTIYGIAYQVKW
jgi:hypothetical protein